MLEQNFARRSIRSRKETRSSRRRRFVVVIELYYKILRLFVQRNYSSIEKVIFSNITCIIVRISLHFQLKWSNCKFYKPLSWVTSFMNRNGTNGWLRKIYEMYSVYVKTREYWLPLDDCYVCCRKMIKNHLEPNLINRLLLLLGIVNRRHLTE